MTEQGVERGWRFLFTAILVLALGCCAWAWALDTRFDRRMRARSCSSRPAADGRTLWRCPDGTTVARD